MLVILLKESQKINLLNNYSMTKWQKCTVAKYSTTIRSGVGKFSRGSANQPKHGKGKRKKKLSISIPPILFYKILRENRYSELKDLLNKPGCKEIMPCFRTRVGLQPFVYLSPHPFASKDAFGFTILCLVICQACYSQAGLKYIFHSLLCAKGVWMLKINKGKLINKEKDERNTGNYPIHLLEFTKLISTQHYWAVGFLW